MIWQQLCMLSNRSPAWRIPGASLFMHQNRESRPTSSVKPLTESYNSPRALDTYQGRIHLLSFYCILNNRTRQRRCNSPPRDLTSLSLPQTIRQHVETGDPHSPQAYVDFKSWCRRLCRTHGQSRQSAHSSPGMEQAVQESSLLSKPTSVPRLHY